MAGKFNTDYLGNPIMTGDEVCYITVVYKDYFGNWGVAIPHKDGTHEFKQMGVAAPDSPCWIVGEYQKIELGGVITRQYGEYTYTAPFPDPFWDDGTKIIAIKGKSDNITQYLEYKKQLDK